MTDDLDRNISAAEHALKETEELLGKDHADVAEQLDKLAVLLRQKKRLLDAVNCEARARVIRTGDSRPNQQPPVIQAGVIDENEAHSTEEMLFPAETPSAEETIGTKTCPFCAETIKAAALKCRHCGSAVPASTRLMKPRERMCPACGHIGEPVKHAQGSGGGSGCGLTFLLLLCFVGGFLSGGILWLVGIIVLAIGFAQPKQPKQPTIFVCAKCSSPGLISARRTKKGNRNDSDQSNGPGTVPDRFK